MVPGLISGRVIDDEGAPIAAARVFIAHGPSAFPDVAILTDENGSFQLSAPSDGTYEIQGLADGFGLGRIEVTVQGGQETHADIVLEKA